MKVVCIVKDDPILEYHKVYDVIPSCKINKTISEDYTPQLIYTIDINNDLHFRDSTQVIP